MVIRAPIARTTTSVTAPPLTVPNFINAEDTCKLTADNKFTFVGNKQCTMHNGKEPSSDLEPLIHRERAHPIWFDRLPP